MTRRSRHLDRRLCAGSAAAGACWAACVRFDVRAPPGGPDIKNAKAAMQRKQRDALFAEFPHLATGRSAASAALAALTAV
jgi:hypothetical protein